MKKNKIGPTWPDAMWHELLRKRKLIYRIGKLISGRFAFVGSPRARLSTSYASISICRKIVLKISLYIQGSQCFFARLCSCYRFVFFRLENSVIKAIFTFSPGGRPSSRIIETLKVIDWFVLKKAVHFQVVFSCFTLISISWMIFNTRSPKKLSPLSSKLKLNAILKTYLYPNFPVFKNTWVSWELKIEINHKSFISNDLVISRPKATICLQYIPSR